MQGALPCRSYRLGKFFRQRRRSALKGPMAMHGTQLICGSLVVALVLAGQGLGADPDVASGRESGACIGVLGAVSHPGAYEFRANEVKLDAVLRAAGGVRADADQTVRIIRDGQAFTTVRSGQGTWTVRSNDFVVVERRLPSRAGRSNVYLPRELRPGGRVSQVGSSDAVYVGLMNVVGRPVVCEIPHDHATIFGIVKLLEQSEEILDGLRQIYPLNAYESTSPAGGLPSDTVLIFDRSRIQASRLPNFPPPHHVAPRAGSGPLILAVSRDEAPVEPDVPISDSALSEPNNRVGAFAEVPDDAVSVVEVTSIDESIAPALQEKNGDREHVPEQAMVDWRLAVLAVAAIAALAGSLRVRSGPRVRRRMQARLEPVVLPIIEAPEKPRLLDALIEDQLPVLQEPCRLPPVLEFYGRPAGTARTDRPVPGPTVEIAAPHFVRVPAHEAVRERSADRSEEEGAAQTEGPGRRADGSHMLEAPHRPHSVPQAGGKPSVLDRILTRLDNEARP